MKNKLLYLVIFALAAISLASCEGVTTEGMTRITYYPELTLEGNTTLYLDKGTTFIDPGYIAILNGEDVTPQVQVTSNVDMSKSGVYSINYVIVNADGFASNARRMVIVTDPNDPVEGIYFMDPNSYRVYNGAKVTYNGLYRVLVLNNGNGTYNVDDLLGGWYSQRANYGTSYAMQGRISVADDGSVTMLSSYVPGWGDSANFMADGMFDAATKCLSWMIEYTSNKMEFYVTMYK